MNIGALIASIGGDTGPLKDSLKQAETAMNVADKNMAKSMQNVNESIKKAGQSMQDFGKKASLYLTAPIVAAGGFAIKMASDYEESINKVDVAFKDNSKEVKAWAKTTLRAFGIAEGTALDMAALFGDMGTSMGIATDTAAELSMNMVGLAGDLASFKNIGIDQAMTALNGVFTGETESLKRLGVVMTEENLKMFALSQGIQKNIKDMTQAEKVNLRYAFVMNQTKNAQGDFARTQGGAANQMRIFQESLKELGVVFGQVLLPYFTKIITKINTLLQKFAALSPTTKKWIVILAGVAAAIGPLSIGLGTILKLIPAIAAGGKLIMTGWFPVIAVITAVAGAFMLVSKWQKIAASNIDETAKSAANILSISELEKRYNQATLDFIKIDMQTSWLVKKAYDAGIMKGTYADARFRMESLKKAIELAKEGKKTAEDFNEDLDVTKVKIGELPDFKLPGLGQISPGVEFQTPTDEPPMFMQPSYIQSLQAPWKELSKTIFAVQKVFAEPLPTRVYEDLQQFGNGVYLLSKTIREGFTNTFKETKQVILDLGAAIEELAEVALISLAESLGNILAGGSFKDGMQSFLNAIADWAINLGKMMITAGITMSSFWKTITFAPWAAVGLGALLVAVGTAVKGAAGANPTTGGSAGVSAGGSSAEGVNLKTARELLEFNVNVTGEIRADGNQLVTVINNENSRKNF